MSCLGRVDLIKYPLLRQRDRDLLETDITDFQIRSPSLMDHPDSPVYNSILIVQGQNFVVALFLRVCGERLQDRFACG